MVKRSPSDSPLPSPSPTRTPKKKSKISSTQSSPNNSGTARTTPGEWNGEKKEALIDHLISVGLAHCKLDDLALEFDLSKSQVGDATKKSKPNNLRQKVVACARST